MNSDGHSHLLQLVLDGSDMDSIYCSISPLRPSCLEVSFGVCVRGRAGPGRGLLEIMGGGFMSGPAGENLSATAL